MIGISQIYNKNMLLKENFKDASDDDIIHCLYK